MKLVSFASLASFCALSCLAFACEDTKKPPAPTPSGESSSGASTDSTSALVALPPGYTAPEAGTDAAVSLIKTGLCSFQESSYDGQDTKSNEKIVVKIKDDKLVGAEYTYRGSYALDGKTESLSIPVRQGQWLEFEFPMNSGGSKTFKAKIKGNDIEFKGVAAQTAQGSCTWVEATEEETDAGKEEKSKGEKGKKDKSGKKKMSEAFERWRNKTAVVTGVSAGIGRAIATRLAREGMKVALVARRRERLEELATELAPADVAVLPTDLRDEKQILDLFTKVRERFGGVDVLVNNAGLGHLAPLVSGKTEHWREMLDVNVLALAICTREAVTDMQRRGVEGHVIHISSMAGHRVPPESGVYGATKFAVRALTEALRQELRALKSPIRVSAVSPGVVETEFTARFQETDGAVASAYREYKVLESDDIAEAVRYLLATPPHVEVHDILMRPREQAV